MLHRLCASRISPLFVFAAFQVATTTACQFNVTTDACSYEALAEAAFAADPSCGILNVVSSKEVLAELCAEEYLAFGKIGNENEIWDKEYFDGGTAWNEEREYIGESGIVEGKLATYPGDRIEQIRNNVANANGITFPDYIANFDDCELRAAMCCFVQDRQANDNNGNCAKPYDTNCADADPADNTDVCYVDMARAPTSSRTTEGYAVFEEEAEDATHCHGIAWATDPTDNSAKFKGNNLFFVSMYDHLTQRGYARNVPGAPMCGCVEKMPVVTRSDCTQIDATESVTFEYPNEQGGLSVTINSIDIAFNACQGEKANGDAKNNDLEAYYRRLVTEQKANEVELEELQAVSLVGTTYCREAIDDFLSDQGLVPTPACVGSNPEECGCSDVKQADYRGESNMTISGRTCQRWDAQSPHTHGNVRARKPNANLVENYCRNPDDEDDGAWCYTTDPDKRWEYCGIPKCGAPPADALTYCKHEHSCGCRDDLQKDYRGTKNTTKDGLTCQAWDEQAPHQHTRNDERYPDTGLNGGHNYCRNPDNEPGAWCYTTDPEKRWDLCGVDNCPIAYEVIVDDV